MRSQDQQQVDQLYCLAICHRRDVACLRDLSADHLPLLENVRDKGSKVGGWSLIGQQLQARHMVCSTQALKVRAGGHLHLFLVDS